jgi:hypothetical protein
VKAAIASGFSVSSASSFAMSALRNHEDLSPSDFVKKIRELGEKKDSEDAERLASLERDILKGREERAARRAGE